MPKDPHPSACLFCRGNARAASRERWPLPHRCPSGRHDGNDGRDHHRPRDSRPQRPYNLRPVIDAATPPALLLAARSLPETRDAALAELRRRLAEHATAASPGDLARATGIAERTLRRLLAELDAAGLPVAVGWVRARGGGMARARAARRDRAARE